MCRSAYSPSPSICAGRCLSLRIQTIGRLPSCGVRLNVLIDRKGSLGIRSKLPAKDHRITCRHVQKQTNKNTRAGKSSGFKTNVSVATKSENGGRRLGRLRKTDGRKLNVCIASRWSGPSHHTPAMWIERASQRHHHPTFTFFPTAVSSTTTTMPLNQQHETNRSDCPPSDAPTQMLTAPLSYSLNAIPFSINASRSPPSRSNVLAEEVCKELHGLRGALLLQGVAPVPAGGHPPDFVCERTCLI